MIRKNTKTIFLLLVVILTLNIFINNHPKADSFCCFFTLKAICGSVEGADVLNLIRQQLDRIYIGLDIYILDRPSFIAEIIAFRDFDLIYIDYWETPDPFYNIPYPGDIYDCIEDYNGTLGIFGYFYGMDYVEEIDAGMCEIMQSIGGNMSPPNSQERVGQSSEWQHYLMDEILPFIPMFVTKTFVMHWDGFENFNYEKSVIQQWGNMDWEHAHIGQISTSEIVIADDPWENLNPLIQTSSSLETQQAEEYIVDAVIDPLFWIDSDRRVWPHLVSSWEHLSETHFRMDLRENIKWQNDSDNLYTNEYFDSEDVYFTLYCMKELNNEFSWLKNIIIVDDYTIDIIIDTDPFTVGNQYYNLNYFEELSIPILPEHYLNQTQQIDGITPNTNHVSWNKFGESCFGTGLFEITDYKPGIETKLNLFTDSWYLDPSITSDSSLNWVERFGDFSGGLTQLRIRQFLDKVIEELEFESGKIDLFEFSSLQDRYEGRDQFILDPYKDIQYKFTKSMSILGFNMREVRPTIGSLQELANTPGKTQGLAVRKAMYYAINRNEILSIVFGVDKEIVSGPLHPSMGHWRNPDMIEYCYNLGAAYRFMTIAGFDHPSGGWIDWETLCSGGVSINTPGSISVNAIGISVALVILTVVSAVLLARKKRKK